ncbi:MAG: hypothetical protein Tp1100SUR639781_48 [Prokaryotic dsDNA virus sp.]|nr:MAG: hypothetical protein Tp1100SUR639781_48 [Prokaryotic dsDNA virus sp.]|tara:strand:+ start:10466 stop:11713 length:1248 start_codon:yes stop_codon:yes gene_type:complete
MIKKYIEKAMWTPDLEKSLSESKVLPMVRDICHAHDLKVSQRRLVKYIRPNSAGNHSHRTKYALSDFPLDDRQNDNKYCPYDDDDSPHGQTIRNEFSGWQDFESFALAHKGIDVAVVCIDDKNDYCFHADFEIKDRGHSSWDTRTIRSKKLSQVLRALKRKKYVPLRGEHNHTTDSYDLGTVGHYVFNYHMDTRDMCYEYIADITRTGAQANLQQLCRDYEAKVYNLTDDKKSYLSEILMCLFKNKTAIPHNIAEHYTKELTALDEHREDIKDAYEQIKQEMDNGFIAIGVSNNVGYLVGEVTQNPESAFADETGNRKYGIDFKRLELTNSQRVRHLDDLCFYDSLKPTFAMLKLKLENWQNETDGKIHRKYYKGRISYGDRKWLEDIGCYYVNASSNKTALSNVSWVLVPKPKF